ncbi:MAG: hypothetical protein NW223_10110 [Hyphomicrobiaceae bacterium]|nr:hypothetical protein [Hyphomicrobiaceae bacterium]
MPDTEPDFCLSTSRTRIREIRPDDAAVMSAWIARELPVGETLARALPDVLRRLLQAGVLRGGAIERAAAGSWSTRLVGFGLSGFLANAFAEAYIGRPFAHLELTLLDAARRGAASPALLGPDAIAAANREGGMTLLPLLWLQTPDTPGDPQARELLDISHHIFLRQHRGYRLAHILKEAPLERAQSFLRGGFKDCGRIPAGTRLGFCDRVSTREHVVFVASRPDFETEWPGALLDSLFIYNPPLCAFSPAECEVLARAEGGMTDAEIAADLQITPDAVAKRWRSIYARVARHAPYVLRADAAAATRGTEKRRHVAAFVREHPEELRPYRWQA